MAKIDEKAFNSWFSVFILAGMTAALVITTCIKMGKGGTDSFMLLLAAFGSLMGVLSTVCSANGKIVTFLFGLLDVSIYGAMCYVNWTGGNPGLGNALLHFLYFVPMQFVGFFQWRRRGAGGGSSVKARRLGPGKRALVGAGFIVISVAAYVILSAFDMTSSDAFIRTAIVLDVLPLACNIIGQLLMSTAYMEQWLFWIGVNVFSIAMWTASFKATSDSYALIYIIKYAFYLLNSFNGLRIWLTLSRPERGTEAGNLHNE